MLIENRGERISVAEADARYPYDPDKPYHTFLFQIDDAVVLDAAVGGNLACWINHARDSVIDDGHFYIESIRDIAPGEEFSYDHRFVLNEPRVAAACGWRLRQGSGGT